MSDLGADSAKESQGEIGKMLAPLTSSTPRTVTSSSKTTTPSLAEKPVQYKQQKLIIPIIKPITYTDWTTFPGVVAATEKSLKFTGRFNEGTNLQMNENILQNSNYERETSNQFDTNEELVLLL